MKASFFTNDGDLMMMLNVYKRWLSFDKSSSWCKENFINNRVLHEVFQIREQLYDIMNARGMSIKSADSQSTVVLKSICSGFFQNVANRTIKHTYHTLPSCEIIYIHPRSSLFKVLPQWVVYRKIMQTSKPYMREITPINGEWLKEFTPAF